MKSEEEIQNAIELYADMVQKICVLHMKQRVTMNACRERFRGWFHKHADLQTEVEACADLSEASYFLLDTLNQLPPHYRDVLYLFYYEGYKVREISEIKGKNENTIHTWLKRGRDSSSHAVCHLPSGCSVSALEADGGFSCTGSCPYFGSIQLCDSGYQSKYGMEAG